MTHPDYIVAAGAADEPAGARAGLSADRRAHARGAAEGIARRRRARAGAADEWQDAGLLAQQRLAGLARRAGSSARAGRRRRSRADAAGARAARLSTSCWPASWRSRWCAAGTRRQPGRTIAATGALAERRCSAAFRPHRSQRRRWRRSPPTWRSPTRMLRLLQGDVGSGKTVVALLAMLTRSRPARRRR